MRTSILCVAMVACFQACPLPPMLPDGGMAFAGGSSGVGGGTVGVGGGTGQGGGSSGGGTATAGGVSSVRNELVSGTRLKAVTLKGSDGSIAPIKLLSGEDLFWDTQLSTFCMPLTPYQIPHFLKRTLSTPGCIPLFADSFFSRTFVNQSCTQVAGFTFALPNDIDDIRVPTVAFVELDAGTEELRRITPVTRYVQADGGCAEIPRRLYDVASSVPLSDIAPMTPSIDP